MRPARPSVTAEVNAAQRAGEMHHPPDRRLFEDPYARCFVRTPSYRALVAWGPLTRLALRAFDRRFAGLHAEILLRNRFYERELGRALADGIDQVVLLGAGYDSTSLRLDLGEATLYELDAPATQQAKLRVLRRHGLEPRGRVEYVPCDLEARDAGRRLAAADLDPDRPALVASFGVLFYLSKGAVEAVLADLSELAPGSRLLFDYLDEPVVDGTASWPGARHARDAVLRRGEPYTLGLRPERAAAAGFAVHEHVRVRDLCARFGPPGGVWCSSDDYMGVVAAEREPGP